MWWLGGGRLGRTFWDVNGGRVGVLGAKGGYGCNADEVDRLARDVVIDSLLEGCATNS